MGIVIEVSPLIVEMGQAMNNRLWDEAVKPNPAKSLIYKGTKFLLKWQPAGERHRITSVKTVLKGLDAPLPAVFRSGEFKVNFVVLHCSVPPKLKAKPGWYVGENFGLPDAACCINPKGVGNEGKPEIYANGDNFDNIVALFKEVMTGKLQPGNGRDPWSGKTRR